MHIVDRALPKPSSHYIATKSLSNSNGDANCDVQSGSICINGSVASREPCSSVALLQLVLPPPLVLPLGISSFLSIFFSVFFSFFLPLSLVSKTTTYFDQKFNISNVDNVSSIDY